MKEYFEKAVAFVRSWFAFKLNQLRTNLPLRMTLGKFGIWLMKVGRALQIRYANWNSEFRLKPEFHPNPDCCTVHVSEKVTTKMILTFESEDWQPKEMTSMVRELFMVKGIVKVTLSPYEVHLNKGAVYAWLELLPKVEEILLRYLTAKA